MIKDDVWIRTNEIIMRKCVIGKGYNIGAGAIVTKSIPPYSEVSAITAQ